ncbi:dienelactone hydrolase family protein [Candidatus Fermentibacteria bacterium]|nr:dienelactone hydrolase family protein [Candidatus Fermentibacteria bacterium]
MMTSSGAAVIAGVILTVVLTAVSGRARGEEPPVIREETLPNNGGRYTISIPKGYASGKPVPLVVALHYGGTVTPYFSRPFLTELIEPGLRTLGAIIVAPDCRHGRWTSPEAETSVLALRDYVQSLWTIDPRRTLITGYSMGGTGAWTIASRHQDRFTAALILAGRPQEDSGAVPWRIPVYVIHSRNDEVMPVKPTADVVGLIQEQGARIKLVVIDGASHYDVGAFTRHLHEAVPWIQRAWKR